MGVEVVVAGSRLRDFPSVNVDDVAIGVQAVEHLISLGHTRIAMIRTSDTDGAKWTSDLHRRTGYLQTLTEHGLPHDHDLLVTAPYGVDAGAIGMERLLSLADPPTAVFCYSDDIAVRPPPPCDATGCGSPTTCRSSGSTGTTSAHSSRSRASTSRWSPKDGQRARWCSTCSRGDGWTRDTSPFPPGCG